MAAQPAMRQHERAALALDEQPGHLIRRAHQIAVSAFHATMGGEITPVQYAILKCLEAKPGIDQVTLAHEVALDTSSAALTAVRLETKGWIARQLAPKRQRCLFLTAQGRELLQRIDTRMPAMHGSLLDGFSQEDQREFLRLLRHFTATKNALSRAPYRPQARAASRV
jgi:DNA-binding MarR family transcriptional regulator